MSLGTQLIVALDAAGLPDAERIVRSLSPAVSFFKIGSQLFTACGPEVVQMVHRHGGKVFLDLKFHDIPHTVAEAGASAQSLGVHMFNVHAAGGEAMLRTLMQRVQTTGQTGPVVLGVTVLTSMDRQQLNQIGVMRSVKNQVVFLARLCQRCGLQGVVCSGKEVSLLRRVMGDSFILVVPGVRPAASAADDQTRIVTPAQAAADGADYIVVGRPIIASPDPCRAAAQIIAELQG